MDNAHRAFEAGNFAEARRLATDMLDAPDAPTVDAARDVLRRTGHDPLIKYWVAACAALFILIATLMR